MTMLVLTQKVGEAVFIGEGITVRVLAVNGDAVKVGYEAPKEINIVRETLVKKLNEAGVELKGSKDSVIRPRYRIEK
jgi:carbon storage regulator